MGSPKDSTQVQATELAIIDLKRLGKATHVIAKIGETYISFIGEDAAQTFDRFNIALNKGRKGAGA
jgi:hypothetical protein